MNHTPLVGLPFTGVATFARAPFVPLPDTTGALTSLRPHFAVYGLPYDGSVGFRPGQRLAPRTIRDLSTRFAMEWGPDNPGFWDLDRDEWFLKSAGLVDVGDVDPLYTDLDHLDASAAALIGTVIDAGAIPIGLGGDHSVSFCAIRALAPLFAPGGRYAGQQLEIVQIDAHLDYTDTVGGTFTRSNSSPMRRASELDFVGGITCLGLRGLRTNHEAHRASIADGHRLVTMQQIRTHGLDAALAALPEGRLIYLTLDIDGLDPTVAPGTSSPEADGFTYAQVRELLRAALGRNQLVAADIVEVNPYLDVANMTSLLAARAAVEIMAFSYRGGQ